MYDCGGAHSSKKDWREAAPVLAGELTVRENGLEERGGIAMGVYAGALECDLHLEAAVDSVQYHSIVSIHHTDTRVRARKPASLLLRHRSATIVTSEHAPHTCGVCSESQRHPRTYSPAFTDAGIRSVSPIVNDVMFEVPAAGYGKLVQLPGAPPGQVCTFPGRIPFSCPHIGIGFIAHVLPGGSVPSDTKVPEIRSSRSLNVIRCVSDAKGTGVRWKQASVSSSSRGQSRN